MLASLRLAAGAAALALIAVLSACGDASRSPYASTGEAARDIATGEARYQEALAVIDSDPTKAQGLLTAALAADLFHGPAHNNLGVLLLKQGKLYEAAGEFEWAARLLPGMPQPRVNLALTLLKGDRLAPALDSAVLALEITPGYLPAHQTAALIKIRTGQLDAQLRQHLAAIVARSTDAQWTDWAKTQLHRVDSQPAER